MNTEDLERLLVSTLRTQLATVGTAVQAPSTWIYVDYPRLDATMPRLSVTLTNSPSSSAAIGDEFNVGGGTLTLEEHASFDIDVWVHKTNKTTGLTPVRGGTSLRDYLADQVVTVILKQRAVLVQANSDLIDIEKTDEYPYLYDEDREIFRKTISIRVTYLRHF